MSIWKKNKLTILWDGEQRRAGVSPVEATAERPRPSYILCWLCLLHEDASLYVMNNSQR
jgi:hypothetical protein